MVPGALPTLRGARRSPWVPQQLEGTPRSPRALGWGWGSEKPDPNQVQVTFRLELAPGLPQGATASERSSCAGPVCGGECCATRRCRSELLLKPGARCLGFV